MARVLLAAAAAVALTSGSAVAWYTAPPYRTLPCLHLPASHEDDAVLRRVDGRPTTATAGNPGVRAWQGFLSAQEVAPLLQELQGIKAAYGISLIEPVHAALYRWQMSGLSDKPPQVNMLRVTGRHEAGAQKLPPWGYGDDFRADALPPQLRHLAERIKAIEGLALGQLRDVTINYRHSHFFRLDAHIDPPADGENVFIVGLDSDTVLTLCPQRWWRLTQLWEMLRGALTLEDERALVKRQAERSWTSKDVDVLMQRGTLVLLTADARWLWTHGTRPGVAVAGQPGLHDWWGSREHMVLRSPERHSIVFAFDKQGEEG